MGHVPCLARLGRRDELVEDADEVDIDLRDDLDLGGLTDIDCARGEDIGDIVGVITGDT